MKVAYHPWYNREKGTGQAPVHRSRARFRVVMAGRQSGKTLLGIAEICLYAMRNPGSVCWWIAPSNKVAPRAVRGLKEFLPLEAVEHKSEREDPRFELGNGSVIYVKSAEAEGSLVSESLDFAVCDEAGQWKEDAFNQGIRPMFLARPNFRVLLIGTPRGKNWFQRAWLRGANKASCPVCLVAPTKCDTHGAEWESFHWKSEDSPYTSKSELEDARRELRNDTFLQEYEADPLDNASAAFRSFRSCIRAGLAKPDQFSVIGMDLARKLDYSAFIGMNGARQVFLIERSQEDWPEQKRRATALSFQYAARAIVDATGSGDQFVADLRSFGVQAEEYVFSYQSKQRLINNLQIAFDHGTISIPDDPILVDELESYEYEYDEETRRYKFSAPEGKHDDLVIALALACWGQRGAMAVAFTGSQRSTYMGRGRGDSYLRRTA